MSEVETVDTPQRICTWIDDGAAAEAIVFAVAEVENISPLQVDTPLNDVIDTDLLDRLFAPTCSGLRDRDGRIVFAYRGHEVTVHADGYVAVDPHSGN